MRLGVILFVAVVCGASSGLKADDPAPAGPEARYQTLLAEARADPEKADWKALRLAFSKTEAYRPYATDGLDRAPVEQELKNGERTAALQALDRVLEGHWMDPSAHEYAASVCERIDEPARARLHETFMSRILDTVFGTGASQKDGQSYDQAWPVLSIREAYMILDAFDLKHGKQALIQKDGHFYDVHTFENRPTGKAITIYFNVDLPRRWLREHGPGSKNF